jgi:hypothetical protein
VRSVFVSYATFSEGMFADFVTGLTALLGGPRGKA